MHNLNSYSRLKHLSLLFCVTLCAIVGERVRGDDLSKQDYFEVHIRPLLIKHCYECHSSESGASEGELLLDSQPAMVRGGSRGNSVDLNAGADKSLLWQAVNYENPDVQMPPTGKLSGEELEHIRHWLDDGAFDPRSQETGTASQSGKSNPSEHWAYKRPQSTAVARDASDNWSRDVVDEMVFRRRKEKGLSAVKEADDRTLVRRLYFDLLGLPPTIQQVNDYIQSKDADRYEKLVNQLTSSPAFGERMARHWMDVVRYADTRGYVFQEERRYKDAYKYRDWLINAFNSDLPYDQFVKYQVAADVLDPGNANNQQVAMGMMTLGRRFLNNPNDIADDRIDVVTRGTMALSVICARCHDHKYDPIEMADYYSLHSVFVNSTEPNSEQAPLALIDKPDIGPAVIFNRGNPRSPGDQIDKKFVKFISLSKEYALSQGSGRINLAEAIVDPNNPLTARTIVNRVWGWVTNSYMVSTPSDFGVRCPAPLQQDVLDQLACDFMQDGWSIKRLVQRIVMTSTYRMSSSYDEASAAIDPTNDYWWQANRRRIDFESLRDAMLATTNRLDPQVGGDSVKVFQAPYSGRRTIYALIDRLDLPGVFRAFDFANPDTHVPIRSQTTVPQQGLFLLNNEFVFDTADQYAVKLASQSNDQEAMIETLFNSMYQRDPSDQEMALCREFLAHNQTTLPATPESTWSYGYAPWDGEPRTLGAFTAFPHFSEGQWKGGATLPDPNLGWCFLSATTGHPDTPKVKATVRRWTAPFDGKISIGGKLKHLVDQGDGVELFITHQDKCVSQVWKSFNNEVEISLEPIDVKAGDTINFVVDSIGAIDNDSFEMRVRVRYQDKENARYNSEKQFTGPPPKVASELQQLIQAMFASNEFAFVD